MKCKYCAAEDGSYGKHDRHNEWHLEHDIHHLNSDMGFDLFNGGFPDCIIIKLRVRDKVLLCQHCDKLHYPNEVRNERLFKSRKSHEATTGQMQMFPGLIGESEQ